MMNDDNIPWENIAKSILERENILRYYNYPEPTFVLIEWRNDVYIGSVQHIAPEFSNEIILLSKSTQSIPVTLVTSITKLDRERRKLCADESLDLYGRQHVLRMIESRLMHMTSRQTEYMMKHAPNITEI